MAHAFEVDKQNDNAGFEQEAFSPDRGLRSLTCKPVHLTKETIDSYFMGAFLSSFER